MIAAITAPMINPPKELPRIPEPGCRLEERIEAGKGVAVGVGARVCSAVGMVVAVGCGVTGTGVGSTAGKASIRLVKNNSATGGVVPCPAISPEYATTNFPIVEIAAFTFINMFTGPEGELKDSSGDQPALVQVQAFRVKFPLLL